MKISMAQRFMQLVANQAFPKELLYDVCMYMALWN